MDSILGKPKEKEDGEHWLTVSDLMAGLMMVFLFIAIAFMRHVSIERDKIKDVAVAYQQNQVAIFDALNAEFENDLDYLLKHYTPIDLESFAKLDDTKIDRPVFLLSFDDGLAEIKTIIAPILKRKGIKATIFINSAFTDNKAIFFRYKSSLLIDAISNKNISGGSRKEVARLLGTPFLSQDSIRTSILSLKYNEQKLIEELATILEVDFAEYLRSTKPYLNSSDLIELQNNGHSVGAHSVDHPEFRHISNQEQIQQAVDSLLFVKEKFDPTIRSFSFPFTDYGVEASFFEKLRQKDICDLSFGCAGLKHDSAANHFQRIPFEDTQRTAKQTLKFEYFYFLLKLMIRKNTIIRK